MGQIPVHEFISLGGVYEGPSFTAPHGFTEAMGRRLDAFVDGCTGILLGRRTFENGVVHLSYGPAA